MATENETEQESLQQYSIEPLHDFEGTIARWFQFKEAAYSITMDDGTYDQYGAIFPVLEELNIKGTFYLAAALLDQGSWNDHGTLRRMMSWEQAAKIAEAGHEIGSHSYNHIDLSRENVDLKMELLTSREHIEEKLPGVTVETFCWPHWRESESAIDLASQYYISARSGNGIVSYYMNRKGGIPSDPPEDMFKVNALGFLNTHKDTEWQNLMDKVYDSGSWFVSSYHGVDNGHLPEDSLGWSALSAEKFTETLLYPINKGFWMETFANVSKYIYERDQAVLQIKNKKSSISVTLDDQLDNRVYNQKLSVSLIKPENWTSVVIIDDSGKPVVFREHNNRLFLDIFPDGKQIVIKPLLTRQN